MTHVASQQELLKRRTCGLIVVERTRLVAIYGRWWPHFGNRLQAAWDQRFRSNADYCELYYHVPWSAPQFLTLSYIRAGERATPSTVMAACVVLDEIARLKNASAMVAHVTNGRISDRVLQRCGWEPHCPSLSGRHFIKRFYGKYPAKSAAWQSRLGF